MMERLTKTAVEVDAHGAVIVVKRPGSEAGAERIAWEGQILEAARHPGVVDLVATTDSAGSPAVVTRWLGPHTLTEALALPLTQAAGVIAALGDCVADLHELGIVHGAITADHVILSPAGQPMLCSFGSARLLTAGDGVGEIDVPVDVAALGSLLHGLVGDDVELEPIPERRGWRRKPRWQGYQRRALLTLADQATHDEHRLRPTARAFAAAIHDSIPDARLGPIAIPPQIPPGVLAPASAEPPREPGPEPVPGTEVASTVRISEGHFASEGPGGGVTIGADTSPRPGRDRWSANQFPSRRAATAVAGLFGVALLLYGIFELRTTWARASHVDAPKASVAATASQPPAPLTTARQTPAPVRPAATTTPAPPRRCRAPAPTGVDLDGDGCSDPVRVSGEVVQAGAVRYGVGRAGDRVIVGDWTCDGRATAAVLRPSTGDVFVFPRWAAPGREVTVKPTTRVAGGSNVEAMDTDHDGCSELWVRTRTGAATLVDVRSRP